MSKRVHPEFADDFRREAVRLRKTSGRTIKQVADDLGFGLSTLTRWRRKHDEAQAWADDEDRSRNNMLGRIVEVSLRDSGYLPQERRL